MLAFMLCRRPIIISYIYKNGNHKCRYEDTFYPLKDLFLETLF